MALARPLCETGNSMYLFVATPPLGHIDLVVMGGTQRGFLGRMLWPEMAHEVAGSINVLLLIWY